LIRIMDKERILDISWGTIWKIFIVAILLYVIYQIRDILVWFVFALIISILFTPAIAFLKKFKIPRPLAVIFAYVTFFGILILITYLTIPLFISEIKQFSQYLPQYFEKISPPLRDLGVKAFQDTGTFLNTIGNALEKLTSNIGNILAAIFGGIFATIFILSLAMFISFEEKGVERALVLFFPRKYEAYVLSLWEKCQRKVSGWFLTRIIASLFLGLVSFFAFLLLHVPYPVSLALLAGVLNFIPFVGPLLTGVLIFLIVIAESLPKAIFVVVVFILIQQVENHILTPLISKRFVGVPPVLVLLALAVGGVLWKFLGAILAIPLAGILYEFIKEYLEKRRTERTVVL